MKNENTIKKEYDAFVKTEKGKEWMEECKNNVPSDTTAGNFGDYLYDFYPEMLQ